MKYAIDRYTLGKEKEVSASDFYGAYISNKKTRFTCPECGEPVHWCSRGGIQPDKFSHNKKTDTSPECDKRVDGRSELTLYERVGLNLYIKKVSDLLFKLYIGFPALGQALLKNAYESKAQLIINKRKTISITPTNFFENETTLIPIDFIPASEHNYSISYTGSGVVNTLHKAWSDYADGFSYKGAIFNFSEMGGRKIKRGDSIFIGKNYYVISQHFMPSYSEIENQVIGSIYINNYNYNVYLMRINASTSNPIQFRRIENYIQSSFGVWLLEKIPELITLWPPVIEDDGMVQTIQKTKIFCSAISGNDVPQVYTYNGASASHIPIKKDDMGNYTVVFNSSDSDIVASVDRKYVGREVIFRKRPLKVQKYNYSVMVTDISGNVIEADQPIPHTIIKKGVCLTISAKAEIYRKSRDERYQHISVRNSDEIKFLDLSPYDTLDVIVENRSVFFLTFEKARTYEQIDEKILSKGLIYNNKGLKVPLPYWVCYIIVQSKQRGYFNFSNILQKLVGSGKISMGALKYLESIKETFINV